LALAAGPTGFQLVHVRGIGPDGATRLEEPLAAPLPRKARLVAVTSASVTIEHVVPGTRPLLLGTAFAALPGCLVEVAVLGRLDSPAGTRIEWDWDASPIVPIKPGAWHAVSAENPVLVRDRPADDSGTDERWLLGFAGFTGVLAMLGLALHLRDRRRTGF
ncbi:MAG: hypothetical protein M3340_20225, partial [Actinomycetota bacterium]|nr:hypothetical protein [Actinomycetota bacterium]